MFCFSLQFLFCCMLYCSYNVIIVCPDSLCLNLRYGGVAYFIPDDLGWLSAIYYLDKFLGHTFHYMRVAHTSHQEVCSVYLAEYYSKKKIQAAFFPHKERTVFVLFIAKPPRVISFSLFYASLLTLALILDPALTLLPSESPGRAKVLLSGKEGPQNTYFIVCMVIQKHQFICTDFITVTR